MTKRRLFSIIMVFCMIATLLPTSIIRAYAKDASLPELTAIHNANGKPYLSWSAVGGAKSYEVYRADSADGVYKKRMTVSDCHYANTTAPVNATYYYQVAAVMDDDTRVYSDPVSITVGCAAPSGSYALVDGTYGDKPYTQKPQISWDAVEGAQSYKIYRATDKNGEYALRVTTKKLSYTNSAAKDGQVYYYTIAAVNKNGDLTYSAPIKVVLPCDAPMISIEKANGIASGTSYEGKPSITWSAVEGAKSYEIYRSDSKSGSYTLKATTSGKGYVDTGVKPGATFYYKVKAIGTNAAANSPFSNIKSLTASAAPGNGTSNSKLVNYTKISPNRDTPRNHKIDKITIHHMAGNLTVEKCGELFSKSSKEASSNYGIGTDGRVGLYVEECDRSWASANRENDNRAVTIEVANDKTGGNWHVSDTAYNKLIDLCVDICLRNGIQKLNYTGDASGNLTEHRMFMATACPGEYLHGKMPDIAKTVNARLVKARANANAHATPIVTIKRSTGKYCGKPDLTWNAIPDAIGYEVYRADSENGTYKKRMAVSGQHFVNTSAAVNATYYYKVAAIYADGSVTYSDPVHITVGCAAPNGSYRLVNGTYNGVPYTGKPQITWKSVEGAQSYKVYRATSKNGTYSLRATTQKLYYTNSNPKSGHIYYYKIAAVNKSGALSYSEPVKVILTCNAPEVSIKRINGFASGNVYVGKPKVSWLLVDGAQSYKVYRATAKNGSYSLRTTTTRSYFIDSDAKSGTTYYYKVKAVGSVSAANSAYSKVKYMTTSAATPKNLIPDKPYQIKVNYTANTVTVYTYDKNGKYTVPVKAMICSTGIATPRSGSYSLAYTGKWEWLEMQGGVYGHYSTQITGNILFHSVPYFERGNHNSIEYKEFDKLGTAASAGCVRMLTKDARWIFNHKNEIKSVTFYGSTDPGPLGKPVAPKISGNKSCRGWDPTDPNSNNPWRNANITVGNYVGMTETAASQAAAQRGFTVGEIAYKHSTEPKGSVIKQSRKSGSTATMGAKITLTVSAG